MTHAIEKNQVTNGNVKKVYQYRYFTTDGSGICSIPSFNASQHNVVLQNEKLIVIDDDMFTRISIDKDYHHGHNQIDVPLLYLYFNDECFGTGFNFSLSSSKELTANELQEIIDDMHNEKISNQLSLEYDPINEQLLKDAFTISSEA